MHARLAPSSASRRVMCPGSLEMEERYPELEESPHSKEGNAAHYVASEMLKGNPLGDYAPNGEKITNEMIEGAELYRKAIEPYGIVPEFIEKTVTIKSIHPDCWGTPDYFTWDNDNVLYVFDYKFGHRYVEVYKNWQLMEYAAGLIDALPCIQRVVFCIVQPRSFSNEGKVRTWGIPVALLEPYFEILRKQEAIAFSGSAPCTPNPECRDCRARHACKALQVSALTAVEVSQGSTPWELSSEEIGRELRYLKNAEYLLNCRIAGLEEQAKSMIMQGKSVVGFRLEIGNPREYWKKPVDEIVEMGELFGVDLQKKKEVITPAQARKAKLPENVLQSLIEYKYTSLKLTPIDEALPSKIFSKQGDK